MERHERPSLRKRESQGPLSARPSLAGAGRKIAATTHLKGSISARSAGPEPQVQAARDRGPQTSARAEAAQGRSQLTTPSESELSGPLLSPGTFQAAGADRRVDSEEDQSWRRESVATEVGSGPPVVDALSQALELELSKGGESLLRRLADVSSINLELRRQIEMQSQEISDLKESRAEEEQVRQLDALALERRLRLQASDAEARLQAEIDECRERAQQDEQRQRGLEGERALREGERDEARARIVDLEARLVASVAVAAEASYLASQGIGDRSVPPVAALPPPVAVLLPQAVPAATGPAAEPAASPQFCPPRQAALEMELHLVRSRFARETSMREATERRAAASEQEKQRLRAELEQSLAEVQRLRRELGRQSEQ
ncbi:unnamed protein product, partial [Polarella glacialis]